MSQPKHKKLANAIRALSMDAVEKAKSGHPGMPMGMADIAEVLWNRFLKHNPKNPKWFNRDRFILSNGHGCLLQYILLHLTGYDLTIEDLKQFRQLHSQTPGHPEYGITPGVETTTGPLGQGFGNAVGMALAEAILANTFNVENFSIVDHYTYCVVGDGCLMEGISHEVASLAGTLGLGKLIVFYDDNNISIDGQVSGWFLDDTAKRFEAYGWHVIPNLDGHNPESIEKAILLAQKIIDKPSILCCKTLIGAGAPNLAGTEKAHGSPLGTAEVKATRENLHWHYDPFIIPTEIYAAWNAVEKGHRAEEAWLKLFTDYKQAHPQLAAEFKRRVLQNNVNNNLSWQDKLKSFIQVANDKKEAMATRKASQTVLECIIPFLPELMGGSADLSESNATLTKHSAVIKPHQLLGNYLHYGVREFGMSAIMNGLALHGGFIPYGGTFLTFLDYARNAVRLSALMGAQVIYVYTHDSVGLGEDGPTHQPIEHLSMLRATPNMSLWRPCDAVETAIAWEMAIERNNGPTSIALTRQTVTAQWRTEKQIDDIKKGAYILWAENDNVHNDIAHNDTNYNDSAHTHRSHNETSHNGTVHNDANHNDTDQLDVIIIATGSEVDLAISGAKILQEQNINCRVVSMPSMDVFRNQPKNYQAAILPADIPRIAVEAGATQSWYEWVGFKGEIVGINRFGESAPAAKVFEAVGITVEAIIQAVNRVIGITLQSFSL